MCCSSPLPGLTLCFSRAIHDSRRISRPELNTSISGRVELAALGLRAAQALSGQGPHAPRISGEMEPGGLRLNRQARVEALRQALVETL